MKWPFQRKAEDKVTAPIKPDGNTQQLEQIRENVRAYRSKIMRQETSSIERFVLEMQGANHAGNIRQN
jgi:hypothetical protein